MGNDQDVKAPAPPAPPTTEELLAKTPAEIFKLYGVKDQLDTVIDVYEPDDKEGPALQSEMTAHFGGPEGFAAASQDFTEAIELLDPGREFEAAVAGMTRGEENAAIKEAVVEYRDVLGNPMRAQALLQKIYAHPMQPPGRDYFLGKGSPALNDAIAKLWQATTGEPITGRPKSKGDGFVY